MWIHVYGSIDGIGTQPCNEFRVGEYMHYGREWVVYSVRYMKWIWCSYEYSTGTLVSPWRNEHLVWICPDWIEPHLCDGCTYRMLGVYDTSTRRWTYDNQ